MTAQTIVTVPATPSTTNDHQLKRKGSVRRLHAPLKGDENMKLVRGGLSKRFLFNGVYVSIATRDNLPKPVEVMVFEEDTNLILTVDREMYFQEEHPIRLMTEIHRTKGHVPGSLVTRGKSWYAVVIDLNAEKMCDSKWISKAYQHVFVNLEEEKIVTVAINLLGTIHGKMAVKDAVSLFVTALESKVPANLKQVWLIVSNESLKEVRQEVKNHSNESGAL